jgi:hypothetical protein
MKNLLVLLGLFVFMGMLSGCSENKTTTAANNAEPINEFNKTLTLQGKIMDATTGAGIGGDNLRVFLIQGASNRGPDKLNSGSTDPLIGEYAFAGIPISYVTNNTAYKVVVIKTGYQTFEGEFVFDANYTSGSVMDSTYNWIGNIYLYPVGAQAGDVTISVVNPMNVPVPGATVLMHQNINSNVAVNGTTGGTTTLPGGGIGSTTLTATNNLISSITGTTDSNGNVVFAGSTLALGASYTPTALSTTFDGQQLAVTAGTAVVVGTNDAAQQIKMTDLEPTATNLYVVAASNSVTGSIQTTGELALTFNRKIDFDSNGATSFTATATDGVLNATSATAAISADGFTLTLTPSFATPPTVAGTTVTFAGGVGSIIIQGYKGTSYSALAINDINNTAISAIVKMIAN